MPDQFLVRSCPSVWQLYNDNMVAQRRPLRGGRWLPGGWRLCCAQRRPDECEDWIGNGLDFGYL